MDQPQIGKLRVVSEDIKLDWSSAKVQDGTLVIALEGKPEKAWKDAFQRTARLLNHGAWEEVTLKRGEVVLEPIAPGEEDRVRHFLESIVLQANSVLETPEEEETAEPDTSEEASDEDSEDHEMTERLRSFSEADSED